MRNLFIVDLKYWYAIKTKAWDLALSDRKIQPYSRI